MQLINLGSLVVTTVVKSICAGESMLDEFKILSPSYFVDHHKKSGPCQRSNMSEAVPKFDVAWAQAQHVKLSWTNIECNSHRSYRKVKWCKVVQRAYLPGFSRPN